MTGSEPLTFQEEIDMQKSWRDDDSKCTFIILCSSSLPLPLSLPAKAEIGETISKKGRDEKNIKLNNEKEKKERDLLFLDEDFIQNNLDKMIGDVNLFISSDDSDDYSDDDDEDGEREKDVVPRRKSAELDIMVRHVVSIENCPLSLFIFIHLYLLTSFLIAYIFNSIYNI